MSRAASDRASFANAGETLSIRPACSCTAATSRGCWYPMLTLTSWLEKSR